MNIKHRIWLEEDGHSLFGEGRAVLLRNIAECGSLNAAAKKLKMSYRMAWGKLRVTEERLGMKLVEVDVHERGMHLTQAALALLTLFDEMEKEINPILAKNFKKFISLQKKINKGKPS
ncbi:MAG: LysR family transcriptional regulator [Smithellaceae bacterium]|nr:LysR family transcriptional regulator [Smithellaceae bacterium]